MFITTAGGGMLAATVVGGLLGGGNKGLTGGSQSQTQQQQMDPKVAEYVYGLLGNANDIYKQQSKNGGLNDLQRAGLQQQIGVLSDPAFTSGYNQMRNMGMSLMGDGVAGNPWTSGNRGSMGHSGASWGTSAPAAPAAPSYLPAGFNPSSAISGTTIPVTAAEPAKTDSAPSQFNPEDLALLQQILAQRKRQDFESNMVGGI